jgi:hypothetical protein
MFTIDKCSIFFTVDDPKMLYKICAARIGNVRHGCKCSLLINALANSTIDDQKVYNIGVALIANIRHC